MVNVRSTKISLYFISSGCLIVSRNGRELLEANFPLNLNSKSSNSMSIRTEILCLVIPFVEIETDSTPNIPLEQLLNEIDKIPVKTSFDLRILLCFMCGGDSNDIETFFSQLAARFSLMVTNEYGNASFIFNTFIGQMNRKVKFSCCFFFQLKSN